MIIRCDKPTCGSANVEFVTKASAMPFGALTAQHLVSIKEVRQYLCRTCKFVFTLEANPTDPYENTEAQIEEAAKQAEEAPTSGRLQNVMLSSDNPPCRSCDLGNYVYTGASNDQNFQFHCNSCGAVAVLTIPVPAESP